MIQSRIFVSFPPKSRSIFIKRKIQYQPKKGEYLLNHNRSGLLLALQALNLPKGSKVGVMAYNCHTMMNAVYDAGCTICFLDVTNNLCLDLEDLLKKKNGLSAIIVSHLFGLPNDIEVIRKICPNVPIIEDCAHAYGMKQCGFQSDFAVYSIGYGKFPSIGDGGILKVNNKKYIPAIEQLYSILPDYSPGQEVLLFTKLFIMHLLHKPLIYSYFTMPFLKRSTKKIPTTRECIHPKKMAKGIASVYNAILPKIEKQQQQQQETAKVLYSYFSNTKGIHIINIHPSNSNCFMYPLYCDNTSLVKKELHCKKIESETHFKHCIEWAKSFGYDEGDCPNTEELTKHLLMIPTYNALNL